MAKVCPDALSLSQADAIKNFFLKISFTLINQTRTRTDPETISCVDLQVKRTDRAMMRNCWPNQSSISLLSMSANRSAGNSKRRDST